MSVGAELDAAIQAVNDRIPVRDKVTVRGSGNDQAAQLQEAITEASRAQLALHLPDGEEYIITDTLTIPSVFGFDWLSGPPSVGGTVHPAQRGFGTSLTWKGPDDGRPMVRCLAANARLQLHLKGREKDTDPVPQNLVGLSFEKTVVASGKSDVWTRIDDCAIGMRCGKVGDVDGHHCDTLTLHRFEAFGCQSAWELNNEQSMGHTVVYARIGCPRFVDVWAGGKITVLKASILGPCKVLTIRAATPERPTSVGSGNGIFTFYGIEADSQTDRQLQLLDMQEPAGIKAEFRNVILPKGADLLVDSQGGHVTVSGRGINEKSIRMRGYQRKNPSTGLKEWIYPYTVVENAILGVKNGASMFTDDSHHATLEWDKVTGGFSNSRIEPGFETRN